MVHLAPMGYVYDGSLSRSGQPLAVGGYQPPDVTLCGVKVGDERRAVKVVLPHDHADACGDCLRALPSKITDQVQPLLF